jgi:glucan biosynthesis protein C
MGIYFAMRKRSWKTLLVERIKRILVPFLFGMVAIVPLHIFVFQQYYNVPFGYVPHMGHLWFLGNIFVYLLILLPLFFYLKKKEDGAFKKGLSLLMRNPLGPLSISLFFVAEVLWVKPAVFEMYVQTWHGFFLGFLAFFFGFLLVYSGKAFWQTVLKWHWLYAVLAVALFTIRLTIFELHGPGYLLAMESVCWILSIFGVGYKYLNKPSATLAYLSKAAYPVYIIHMLVLYLGAAIILPLAISVVLKFLAITLFTGLGCYMLYEFVIRRVSFLRPLFGLRWKDTKTNTEKILA